MPLWRGFLGDRALLAFASAAAYAAVLDVCRVCFEPRDLAWAALVVLVVHVAVQIVVMSALWSGASEDLPSTGAFAVGTLGVTISVALVSSHVLLPLGLTFVTELVATHRLRGGREQPLRGLRALVLAAVLLAIASALSCWQIGSGLRLVAPIVGTLVGLAFAEGHRRERAFFDAVLRPTSGYGVAELDHTAIMTGDTIVYGVPALGIFEPGAAPSAYRGPAGAPIVCASSISMLRRTLQRRGWFARGALLFQGAILGFVAAAW